MYVRWQLYRSQARDRSLREHNDKRARLKAILVESVRISGKPQQKHIAFLGSTSIAGSDRPRFWHQVTRKLTGLSNRLSPTDREQIVAAISEKLGEQPPTKAELEAFEQQRAQWLGQLKTPDVAS
jgi:hypothetical protein